jgi:uncharacterized protein with GYD domain
MRTLGHEEEGVMPKYMIVATYNAEGMKGVLREGGSERRKMIADMAKNLGGELESFYYAFGAHDVYSVVDLPDNVTAAAMGSHITAGGMVRCEITVLVTPEEMDKAARTKMFYRPPGD